MKKIIVCVLIFFVIVLILTCFRRTEILITGNLVDNDQNNCVYHSSSFARIEDRLYFNFSNNIFHHGTVEISRKGTQIIDHSEFQSKGEVYQNLIRSFQKELYIFNPINGEVLRYSGKKELTQKSNLSFAFLEMEYSHIQFSEAVFFETLNSILYIDSSERLISYSNGVKQILIDEKVHHFHCTEEGIFYSTDVPFSNAEETRPLVAIKKFNFLTETSETICIAEKCFSKFLFDGSYFVAKQDQDSILYIDISNPSLAQEFSNPNTKILDITLFDGNVYFSSSKGIFQFNLKKKTHDILTHKKSEECYVVDDRWVYFVDHFQNLWRVAQEGSKPEKVFG